MNIQGIERLHRLIQKEENEANIDLLVIQLSFLYVCAVVNTTFLNGNCDSFNKGLQLSEINRRGLNIYDLIIIM